MVLRVAQISSLFLALAALPLVSSPAQSGQAGGKDGASSGASGVPTLATPGPTSPGSVIIGGPATTGTTSHPDAGSDTAGPASQADTDARPGPGIQGGRSANGDAKPGLFHEQHVPSGGQ
jgi:hypothetical protein